MKQNATVLKKNYKKERKEEKR